MGELAKQHEQARRDLSYQQRADAKLYSDAIMGMHRDQFNELRDRQATEREDERAALFAKTRSVTFTAAKESLADERSSAGEREFKREKVDDRASLPTAEQRLDRPSEKAEARKEFEQAARPEAAKGLSRSEQIKRDMDDWRRRNAGKDFGREL